MCATGLCTVLLLAVLNFHSLLFCETTHAFSPLLPISPIKPTHQDLFRLRLADSSTVGQANATDESFPILYDPNLVRFRCRIAYDGTSFAGFQLQGGRDKTKPKDNLDDDPSLTKKQKKQKLKSQKNNNPRTIQGEIEKVLEKRFQRVVKVVGAGRTDGGVHARGQAIHFDLYQNETTKDSSFEESLELTLGRMLPDDICAWNLCRATPSLVRDTGSNYTPAGWYNWNAMRTTTGKLYSYRICVGDAMHPSDRYHRWQLPWQGVDPTHLEQILHKFEGEHDFVCFAGALEQNEKKTGIALSTVRTIQKIGLVPEANPSAQDENDPSEQYYRIDIYLDGALYKMVRNIVGTAIDVARGWLDEESLEDLLNKPSALNYSRKNNPCKPAPSNGLTLERVFYPDEPDF